MVGRKKRKGGIIWVGKRRERGKFRGIEGELSNELSVKIH